MDDSTNMNEIYLNPGEYAVATDGHVIRTQLGSGISITLWHRARKIGAMSHFILPMNNTRSLTKPNGRYGNDAMHFMATELERAGVNIAECEARIFGGANMFSEQEQSDVTDIGKRNAEAARQLLEAHNIPVLAEFLYGEGQRNVTFDIATGAAFSHQTSIPKNMEPWIESFKILEQVFEAFQFDFEKSAD